MEAAPWEVAKSCPEGPWDLAGRRQNGYIGGNLWFSYDRVLRVGPAGPALFYYLNEPSPEGPKGTVQGTGRIRLRPGLTSWK